MSGTVEVADGVAVVRIDQTPHCAPARLRALLPTLAGARAVVLHGCDSAPSRAWWEAAPEERQAHARDLHALREELAELPVPVVAAIGGRAPGDLAALLDACDHRVLAEGGELVRVTGTRVLMARKVTAAEALRTGLVDRVVEPDAVLDTAVELASVCKSAQAGRKSCRIVAP